MESNADLLVQSYGGAGGVVGGYAAEPGYTGTGGYAMPGATMWGGSLPATPVPQIMHGTITVDLIDADRNILCGVQPPKAKWITTSAAKLLEQANKAVSEMFKKYPPSKQ